MAAKHFKELEPFAQRLRILRATKSRNEAAKALNVSETKYISWEYCRANPSLQDLAAIAKYYGVSADYLIGLSEDPHGLNGGPTTAHNANVASPGARVNLAPCKDCPHIATLNGTIASLSQSLAAMSHALTGKA